MTARVVATRVVATDPTTATYDCPSGVAVPHAVRLVDSNKVDVADNGNPTTADVFGFVIAKPTTTKAVVRTGGRADVFSGLTPNQRYWLGSGGGLSASPPNSGVVQQIGKAVTATTLQVAIQPRIIL